MGTRHLICIFDGEYKVAQYGQWDSCRRSGVDALNFLLHEFKRMFS